MPSARSVSESGLPAAMAASWLVARGQGGGRRGGGRRAGRPTTLLLTNNVATNNVGVSPFEALSRGGGEPNGLFNQMLDPFAL